MDAIVQYNKTTIEKLISKARANIRKILHGFNAPAVACSFGIDSILALYFTREVIPNIPVLFVDSGSEYPDIYDYIKKIVPEWNLNLHKIPPKHSFAWIVKRHGFPLYSRGNPFKYDRKFLPAHYCCLYLKKRPLEQYIRRNKFDLIIDGLRAEESLIRRYTIKKYGILHFHKGNRSHRYHPLAFWTRQNEMDAIKILNIPVSKLYNKTIEGGITRSGCWCCTIGWKYKRNQFLLKYYPKLWKILMLRLGFAKFLLSRKLGTKVSDAVAKRTVANRPCAFDLP